MAHIDHNCESKLAVSSHIGFNALCVAIPTIDGMKTIQKRLLIRNLEPCLKQVRYHALSIVRKCLLGVLLAIIIALDASAQSSMLSRFYYDGSDEKVKEAIKIADDMLSNERFWNDLRNWKNQYIDNTDTSSYSMAKLADTLKAYKKITNIKLASKLSFHSSTGLTNENRTLITRVGYKQDLKSLAVTIIHEWAHSVDFGMHGANNLQFQHFDDQSRCLNKETASYRVERVAVLILGNSDFARDCSCQLPCYLPCKLPGTCPSAN